ncbi:hypothetical protein [Bradyrhizobium erythrophlei]|uniref:Uncharacterized protein n=1 Tax=Bradyrhizobium erythrophlei TaxID=1437360 RepID=A0A1H4NVW7_9BRAD|nr:hypothetical protein [Bradyrhizobium erythrophlei]SEB99185.1 hypothetical protein SAMN05444164_0743 [Bradyrhizobium erythrophlei]
MKRAIAALTVAALLASALWGTDVQALGLGKLGVGFGKMGRVVMKKQSGGTQPAGCTGPGQLDFSDTCQTAIISALL